MNKLTYKDDEGRARLTKYGMRMYCSTQATADCFAKLEESIPRWISVKDRLPEDRHDVLVYAGVIFPYITVGYYDGLWKFSYNDTEIAGSADYWMPLPEPPREVEDG